MLSQNLEGGSNYASDMLNLVYLYNKVYTLVWGGGILQELIKIIGTPWE